MIIANGSNDDVAIKCRIYLIQGSIVETQKKCYQYVSYRLT
jgi:hypothetical protein